MIESQKMPRSSNDSGGDATQNQSGTRTASTSTSYWSHLFQTNQQQQVGFRRRRWGNTTSTSSDDDGVVELGDEELLDRPKTKTNSSSSSGYVKYTHASSDNEEEEEDDNIDSEDSEDSEVGLNSYYQTGTTTSSNIRLFPSKTPPTNNPTPTPTALTATEVLTSLASSLFLPSNPTPATTTTSQPCMYILGQTLHPSQPHFYPTRRTLETDLLWMTYRCEFPPLHPYGYTTDAGWGCMLRACQMMMAQACRVHFRGRNWRVPRRQAQKEDEDEDGGEVIVGVEDESTPSSSSNPPSRDLTNNNTNNNNNNNNTKEEDLQFYTTLLRWFLDRPGPYYPYSLHNMVAAGLQYEKFPGEWFGPQTACHVVRDLCRLHADTLKKEAEQKKQNDTPNRMMKVFVAQEGCVYKEAVHSAMTNGAYKSAAATTAAGAGATIEKEEDHLRVNALSHPLEDVCIIDPPPSSSSSSTTPNPNNPHTTTNPSTTQQQPPPTTTTIHNHHHHTLPQWTSPLLLLIPLRLGLKTINTSAYAHALAQTFSLPQSVGCVGGSPRHALWFYGATEDGQKILGLDPHTIQWTLSSEEDEEEEEDDDLDSHDLHGKEDTSNHHPSNNNNHPKTSTHDHTLPIHTTNTNNNNTLQKQVYTLESKLGNPKCTYPQTMHCPHPTEMDLSKMDPSLALGFYCQNALEFEDLCRRVAGMKDEKNEKENRKGVDLFGIAERAPDYSASVGVLQEMIQEGAAGGGESLSLLRESLGSLGSVESVKDKEARQTLDQNETNEEKKKEGHLSTWKDECHAGSGESDEDDYIFL